MNYIRAVINTDKMWTCVLFFIGQTEYCVGSSLSVSFTILLMATENETLVAYVRTIPKNAIMVRIYRCGMTMPEKWNLCDEPKCQVRCLPFESFFQPPSTLGELAASAIFHTYQTVENFRNGAAFAKRSLI